jgi:hypothetical protein
MGACRTDARAMICETENMDVSRVGSVTAQSVARVRWEATTRRIYFDELPRITRSHREFAAAVTGKRG